MAEPTTTPDPPAFASADEIRSLLTRAQKGDASTLPVLRRMMQDPGFGEFYVGSLAHQAERSLIDAMAGEDLALREGLLRKLELLRAELAGPDPTPPERLLVERAAACWLQTYEADIRYAQAKDPTLAEGEYCQRRMDRAHRRFLQAVKALELVRRLAAPVLRPQGEKPLIRLAACSAAEEGRDTPRSAGVAQ